MPGKSLVLMLILAVAPGACTTARAADLFVAPGGNDAFSGSLPAVNAAADDGPLATVAGARDAVRRLKAAGALKSPVRVLLRGGVYRIGEPIVFTAEDSGTQATRRSPMPRMKTKSRSSAAACRSPAGRRAKGRCGRPSSSRSSRANAISASCSSTDAAPFPRGFPTTDVFVPAGPLKPLTDREAARRDPSTRVGFVYQNDDLKPWSNLDDAILVHYHSWTTSRHHIESLDPATKTVRLSNPSGWPFYWWGDKEKYYVESVREGLDAPGEFYLDRKTGLLTYYPREGEDMARAEVVAPLVEDLLRLEGDAAAGKLVENLHFQGLSLQYTAWTMPRTATGRRAGGRVPDDGHRLCPRGPRLRVRAVRDCPHRRVRPVVRAGLERQPRRAMPPPRPGRRRRAAGRSHAARAPEATGRAKRGRATASSTTAATSTTPASASGSAAAPTTRSATTRSATSTTRASPSAGVGATPPRRPTTT